VYPIDAIYDFHKRYKMSRGLFCVLFFYVICSMAILGLFMDSLILNIKSKQNVSTASVNDTGLQKDPNLLSGYIALPNARACIYGTNDVYQLLSNQSVSFSVNCTLVYSNKSTSSCLSEITPLQGYTHEIGDVMKGNSTFQYYPYWMNNYCFYFSSAKLQADWVPGYHIYLDMLLSKNISISSPSYGGQFDVTLFDPRSDPIAWLYQINDNRSMPLTETYLSRFLVGDLGQLPNEIYLSDQQAYEMDFEPVFHKAIKDHPWNYVGVKPIRENFWDIAFGNTPNSLFPNTSASVKLLTSGDIKSAFWAPTTLTESRAFTISMVALQKNFSSDCHF